MSNEITKKPIRWGFIGGMGRATSQQFIRWLGAENPQVDFRYIDLHSRINPILEKEYIEEGKHSEIFEKIVVSGAENLALRGVTHVTLLCNTATKHAPAIRRSLDRRGIKFISIVDAVTNAVKENNLSKPLILATNNTTFRFGLYDSLPIVKPSTDDQSLINRVIHNILSGKTNHMDVHELVDMALTQAADGFLFACTDLAIIKSQFETELNKRGCHKTVLESTEELKKIVLASRSKVAK